MNNKTSWFLDLKYFRSFQLPTPVPLLHSQALAEHSELPTPYHAKAKKVINYIKKNKIKKKHEEEIFYLPQATRPQDNTYKM